ncbi:MAG TPA: hypothetical protein VGM82_01885 [Gemmatimonadaceae bacterium]|jgi:hypothetical protein
MKKQVLALTLTAMLAAGCSDSAVAPKAASNTTDATINGGGANAALTSVDTLRFAFVIDPSRNVTYNLGAGNTIVFPAHSLCDVNKSSYGDGEWDKPCTPATSTVTINTKAWLDAQGLAHVDFDRHVRFVPTLNPAGWVTLSLYDYGAATLAWMNIEYCKDVQDAGKNNCKDESKDDATLATVKNPITGQYTRRLKHFSGYSLTSGRGASDMD